MLFYGFLKVNSASKASEVSCDFPRFDENGRCYISLYAFSPDFITLHLEMANHRYPNTNDDPPNSRLFIIAGKGISEEEYHKCFGKYGTIQDVWIVKDRQTSEEKGMCFCSNLENLKRFLS